MRRILTAAFIGTLALAITGCPSSNTQQTINSTPSPSTTPVAVQTPSPVPTPLVAQDPSSATVLAPGLIQPTNATQRTKQVAKGNRDPFTALFVPPPVPPTSTGNIPTVNSSAPTQAPSIASSPTASRQTNRRFRRNSVAVNGSRTAPRLRNTPNQSNSNNTATSTPNLPSPPGMLPNTQLQPELPPAPQIPDLAQKVMVMGVIQIGEQTQAIVQVPSEATSRYVQEGQRLSNGQVLVKRIELNAGAEPIVILEQYGVEVSKAVGEQTPNPEQQTTPTAAVPVPLPNNRTTSPALPPPPQNINNLEASLLLPALSPNTPVAVR